MAKQGFIFGPGEAKYPHLKKPDTKYNEDGVYKTKLILDGKHAIFAKDKIDAAVDAAYAEEVKSLTPAQARKAVRYYPYEMEVDQEGNETGRLVVSAKQAAKIKLKSGEIKDVKIPIFDAKNRAMSKDIWSGSTIKLKVIPRNVVLKTNDPVKIGVQLAISQVQVVALRAGGGQSAFDAEEDGYDSSQDTNDDANDSAANDEFGAGEE